MNVEASATIDTSGAEPAADAGFRRALEETGAEVVMWLRGYEGEKRDSGRRSRPAHPTLPDGKAWADVTGRLKRSLRYVVKRGADGWELEFRAGEWYASLVEAKGFYVLRHVEQTTEYRAALNRAMARHAPGAVVS